LRKYFLRQPRRRQPATRIPAPRRFPAGTPPSRRGLRISDVVNLKSIFCVGVSGPQWCGRRSIRMVRAPSFFLTRPPPRAAGCFFLERTPLGHGQQPWSDPFASSAGGPGPVPPAAETDANIDPAAAWAGPPSPAHAFNAPTPELVTPSHFWPVFWRSEAAPNSGQTNPSPIASTGGRSGQSGTLMGATGGTQTHSRRTRSKLRQLRYARQGLVRVPESNTKYGGKRRKNRGRLVPAVAAKYQ